MRALGLDGLPRRSLGPTKLRQTDRLVSIFLCVKAQTKSLTDRCPASFTQYSDSAARRSMRSCIGRRNTAAIGTSRVANLATLICRHSPLQHRMQRARANATFDAQRLVAKALGDDLGAVTGTSLDKGVELDALAKFPKDERKVVIDHRNHWQEPPPLSGSKSRKR